MCPGRSGRYSPFRLCRGRPSSRFRSTRSDPAGNTTSYSYDALGDLTSRTDPLLPGQSSPGTWTYSYDAAGEQLSETSPLHQTTQETWDYFGGQKTSTDALNNTTGYTYDYLGDQTSATTPDGSTTTSTYDHLGELTSTADAYGDTTTYTYNHSGQVSQVMNPDTSFTQYSYDQAGRLTGVADYPAAPAGQGVTATRSESFGYDPDGNQTSVKDWNGDTTSYSYDAAGDPTSTVQPVSSSSSITTSTGYDAAGNQTAATDGNGNTTWTTYNPWNLPESVIEPATPAAATAADRTWTTSYDKDGQPSTVTQPGGITVSYGYNPLGEQTSQSGTGASAATSAQSYTYDLDGRMTGATAPGGTDTFTWNANNELSAASGPSGTSGLNYNGDQLLSSDSTPAGTTSYTYDSADRLATLADPLTGATLAYGYNANSQPTSVAYSAGGASGPKQSFGYDPLDRLASDTVTSASGATLASEAYQYDNNDNLTSQTTGGLLTGAGATSYGYDEANRLTSAASNGTTTSYGYDNDGNLTSAGGTSYTYDAQDQLTASATSAGTTNYAYTLSGSLASVTPPSGTAQTYTSNAYGQTVTAPGGVSYGYDALGRLVTRTTSAASSDLSWLGDTDTLTSDGTYSYSYDPAGNVTAVQASGGSPFVTMSDLRGDLAATFSPTATAAGLAGSASYSPYGTATTSGYRPSIGYQGNYTDPSTGQVDMNARWYNPSAGSFTSNDTLTGSPVSSTLDGNPYAYAGGNPLTTTDPTGNFSCGFCSDVTRDISGAADRLGNIISDTAGDVGTGLEAVGEGFAWGAAAISVGEVALLTGIFTAADWLLDPTSTASGCGVDIICAAPSPGTSICYYCYSPYGPHAPGSNPVNGGSPGSGTTPYGCTIACYPPPPPQDCFAVQTCTAPPASHALRYDQWITVHVHDVTSASQLLKNGKGVHEQIPVSHTQVSGTKASPTTNGNPASATQNDIDQILKDIRDVRPVSPVASIPTSVQRSNPNAPKAQPAGNGGGSMAGGGGGSAENACPEAGEEAPAGPPFPNRDISEKELDLQDAGDFAPAEPGTPEFDQYISSGEIRWAVLMNGKLVALPGRYNPEDEESESAHGALTGDVPPEEDCVLAAGMAEISKVGGKYIGNWIDRYSGHFWPTEQSLLETGIPAFEEFGITFPTVNVEVPW